MAFKSKAIKYAKKQGGRLFRAAKKRYVSKGSPNIKNITKDVMMLKKLVNVEKKRVDVNTAGPISFGATAGAGVTGAYSANVGPSIAQGLTGATRTGNSVKLVSACMDIQFNQSVNTVNQVRIRYALVVRPDSSSLIGATTALTNIFENNPFSGVIDYHSNRDAEFFSQYKIIKQGTCTLYQDSITAGISYKQIKIPLRLNYHLKYNTDASVTTTKNQMYLFALADTGDGVALTGAQIQFNIRYYFTDN